MRGIAIPAGASPTCRRPPSMSRGRRGAPGSRAAAKPETRRLALGTDQDAGARPGGAALARPSSRDLMDGQCGLPGRSRATKAPVEPAPRAAYGPQAGHEATPSSLPPLLPAWPASHPGGALSGAAPASGVHTSRTVAEQSRAGRRSAPCLPTASQSGIRGKPTLESSGAPLQPFFEGCKPLEYVHCISIF
jgi:hypothetical protein